MALLGGWLKFRKHTGALEFRRGSVLQMFHAPSYRVNPPKVVPHQVRRVRVHDRVKNAAVIVLRPKPCKAALPGHHKKGMIHYSDQFIFGWLPAEVGQVGELPAARLYKFLGVSLIAFFAYQENGKVAPRANQLDQPVPVGNSPLVRLWSKGEGDECVCAFPVERSGSRQAPCHSDGFFRFNGGHYCFSFILLRSFSIALSLRRISLISWLGSDPSGV